MTAEVVRWDPTGTFVLELREDADVLASVPSAKAISGGRATVSAPYIEVQVATVSSSPFGRSSDRLGLASWSYSIKCVRAPGPTADIDVKNMASAVVKVLRRGWRSRDTGGHHRVIVRSSDANTVGPYVDPTTGEPTVIVNGTLIAAARAAT